MMRIPPDEFEKQFGVKTDEDVAGTAYYSLNGAGLKVDPDGFMEAVGDTSGLNPDILGIDDFDFLSSISGEFERPLPDPHVTPMWKVEEERERLIKSGKKYSILVKIMRPIEIILGLLLVASCIGLALLQNESIFRWFQNLIF